jgi:hypothetical protein
VALSGALTALAATEPAASHMDWIAEAAPAAILAGRDVTPPFGP